MARVPYLEVPDLPPVHLFQALAHRRSVLDAYVALGRALLLEGELPQRLKELALLQVALERGSDYLWSHHRELAQTIGVSDADLDGLRTGTLSGLDVREVAAVRFAAAVESAPDGGGGTAGLEAAGFTPSEIVELTLLVTFYGMTARLLAVLEVDLEDGRIGIGQP
jgi:alkylhydroperoxidase family enzyme